MDKIYPIYEFLLWNNCNNSCKFCHQKANKLKYPGKFPDNDGKLKSIHLVKDFIKSDTIPKHSHILLMGGELFDTKLSQDVENAFISLADMIAAKIYLYEFGFLYMNTNLIYEDLSLLDKFLFSFTRKKLQSNIKFTTSYDLFYRYRDSSDKTLVENNMKYISKRYPDISRVANFVLTKNAVDFMLNTNFSLEEFKEMFGFKLNLIPYIHLDGIEAPTRSRLASLLLKLENKYNGFLKEFVTNIIIPQDRVLWEFNGDKLVYASSETAQCGHNINFRRVYADSNICFACDCKNLFEIL